MAQLNILHYPDPRLRKHAQPVETVDDQVRNLVSDMLETMYAAPGIGLAATQVNVQKRIVVMDVSEDKNQPMIFINPTLLEPKPCSALREFGSVRWIRTVSRLNWKRAACWRLAFSTKLIIWMASCL